MKLALAAAALWAAPSAALAQHGGHGDHAPAPAPAPVQPAADGDLILVGDFHVPGGALGDYPLSREASGTAWQPDSSSHRGIHTAAGRWGLMGHAHFNAVYDRQEGPRGDEAGFVSGMAMGSARRDFENGHILQLRAMLSPDPAMGARGFPQHLSAGETADGVTNLVDRQHPHDLFMELSASYGVPLGGRASAFVYGGLPGAPAFGPPAFMHRFSAMDSPEAPISHHWLDSTHIAFGVLTAGLVLGDVRIEASRFNGREPDQRRWDIETGPLDSTALRLSANPGRNLSLQASWAHLVSPEQLAPGENETRWSASAIYTRRVGARGWWSATLAWGRRAQDHGDLDAFTLESAAGLGRWTLFGRAERIETNELLGAAGGHGPAFEVAKVSAGLIRDFAVARHVRVGLGGLYALNFVPGGLEGSYGGDPDGAMLFLRLRID
ncbi:MAG: hypothetical protein QOI38_2188 [Sphingomonadales bacterium]|jgi:hypothetical protein|nr:hypothetical protein [Sphingomonadales bacterium]